MVFWKSKNNNPYLFNKWQPKEFKDSSSGNYISQVYTFPFADVEVRFNPFNNSETYIQATAGQKKYDPDKLFEPKIREMYKDAKQFMGSAIESLAKTYDRPLEVDSDKVSRFVVRKNFFHLTDDL